MLSHDVRGVADAMTESVQDVATGGGHVVFETDRIRVRPWRTDEADRFLDILSRYDVAKWLCDGEPELMKDRAEAVARIERYENRRTEDPHTGIWAIEVKQTGVPAGTVLLVPLPNSDAGEIEIGWHLIRTRTGSALRARRRAACSPGGSPTGWRRSSRSPTRPTARRRRCAGGSA